MNPEPDYTIRDLRGMYVGYNSFCTILPLISKKTGGPELDSYKGTIAILSGDFSGAARLHLDKEHGHHFEFHGAKYNLTYYYVGEEARAKGDFLGFSAYRQRGGNPDAPFEIAAFRYKEQDALSDAKLDAQVAFPATLTFS